MAPLNEPLIIAVSVGAGVVLVVALVWIIRWARRKPSTQLPPPRPSFLSPYSANRHGGAGYRGTTYSDDEAKFVCGTPPTSHPYGLNGSPSDSSQIALFRTPDGEYYRDRVRDSYPTDSEAGSINALAADHRLRHTPSVPSPLNGSPALRPLTPYDLSSSPSSSVLSPSPATHAKDVSLSTLEEAVKTDAQLPFPSEAGFRSPPAASDSPTFSSLPSTTMPRPRRSVSNSLNQSFHGHVPPSNTVPSRRQSRHSIYSVATSTQQDHRRTSIRGAPHKTPMQIVLPEPLAPLAARASGVFANDGSGGRTLANTSNRRSRADLWTEANTSHSRRTSEVTGPARVRRKSRESTESRSFELPPRFQLMEPPPPLPTLSRSGTPNSFSSARTEAAAPFQTPSPASTLAERPKPPPSPAQIDEFAMLKNDTPPSTTSPPTPILPAQTPAPDTL